jgi:hypothetical protein
VLADAPEASNDAKKASPVLTDAFEASDPRRRPTRKRVDRAT